MTKAALKLLLEVNGQEIPTGESKASAVSCAAVGCSFHLNCYDSLFSSMRQSVSTALLLQILDALSDCMAFGALEPCPECKEGQLALRYMNGPLCNATACCAIGIY